MEQMNEYYRLVIDLYKECLTTTDRVNDEKSLHVLTEIAKAISVAKALGNPYNELCQLKADVELIRALNE